MFLLWDYKAETTALLKSLDSTNIFGSLRYKYIPLFYLQNPLRPSQIFLKNPQKEIERIHKDGILIGSNFS